MRDPSAEGSGIPSTRTNYGLGLVGHWRGLPAGGKGRSYGEMRGLMMATAKFIKVCRNAERFWLRVIRETPRGYEAIVANDLINNSQKWGDAMLIPRTDVIDEAVEEI